MDDFEFNPRPRDDKGVGQVKLGDKKGEEVAPQGGSKKWMIAGVAGAALLGLVGIFAVVSGGDEPQNTPPAPPPRVEHTQPQTQPQPVPRVETPRVDVRAISVEAKRNAIYRNDGFVYRDQNGNRGEVYINNAGRQVRASEDFAVHASLFGKGGMSVLVAEGPHAGSRVSFFPVHPQGGDARVVFDQMGYETVAADGVTTIFQLLPPGDRTSTSVPMARPTSFGHGVSVQDTGRQVEVTGVEGGQRLTAFIVSGEPEVDGKFSVQIWNGDRYSFDLSTGDYYIDSAFLANPNYEEDYERSGIEVTPQKVTGAINITPAPRPNGFAPRP
ncbi:MAG: hypothetical protein KKA05_01820 [Alphaproteobacteria bacterium]|nr:hypothetical protein [Alphaproteobacteria bacterium]